MYPSIIVRSDHHVIILTTEGAIELQGLRAESFTLAARALFRATGGCQCHVCGGFLGSLAEFCIMGSSLDDEETLLADGHFNAHVMAAAWEAYDECFAIAMARTHEVEHVHTGARLVLS